MNIREITKIVHDEVCRIQELSGRTAPIKANDDLVPIGDCDGFDSVNGAEAAVRIGELTKCPQSTNPFVEGNRALTVVQIAQNIYTALNSRK